MEYVLGVLTGISLSTLVCIVIVFLRSPIERVIAQAQPKIEAAGPRRKGFIVEAESADAVRRREIIERNKEAGIDTNLSDLV